MAEGTGPHSVFVVHTQLAFTNTIYLNVKKDGTLYFSVEGVCVLLKI